LYEIKSDSKKSSPESDASRKAAEKNQKLESLSHLSYNPQRSKHPNQKRSSLLAKQGFSNLIQQSASTRRSARLAEK